MSGDTTVEYSDFYDVGDAIQLSFTLNVLTIGGTTPSVIVTAQSSVDGLDWGDLGTATVSTNPGLATTDISAEYQISSAGKGVRKYLRFKYEFGGGGTSQTAVFSVTCIIKTRDSGAGLSGLGLSGLGSVGAI